MICLLKQLLFVINTTKLFWSDEKKEKKGDFGLFGNQFPANSIIKPGLRIWPHYTTGDVNVA